MKETIKYYYDIDVDNLEEIDGKYHFKFQNRDFFFIYYNRDIDELDDIILCINDMKQKGILVNDIILNRNQQFLTKVDEYNYILMAVSNASEEYDIFDIMNYNSKLQLNNKNSKLYRNNWKNLWIQKVDYLEYQIRELGLNKSVIKDSFSYYVGLAENAISYVDNANFKCFTNSVNIVLSHRRIFYPNYKLNFMNPLSFIFDLEVRDIAEYLKSLFFSDDEFEDVAFEDLVYYLKLRRLSIYEYSMLYARLLYPSYYFDIYEEVMNKDRDEEDLVLIINKNQKYEEFLKKTYLEITKYAPIEKIDWLIS